MNSSNPPCGRRAGNRAARAAFEEARRAGLAQRHLRKLHYLSRHPHRARLPPEPSEAPSHPPAA
ncbi:hypothetical protein [Amycolatopsis magusensis]|uniref:hypothetical protein n=1 Tax=Amycolatopsis magusensis TaxID=882444 RepID=UPI0024A863EF|nr:hypothetical protein [Amycolatopsis magusensis]MDI5980325.1 hypothetical protein [Amycolatopsis magusensis]